MLGDGLAAHRQLAGEARGGHGLLARERADDLAAGGVGERGEQRAELGLAQARHREACAESAAMRGPTTGARLRSTTTKRVPPGTGSSVHATREGSSPHTNARRRPSSTSSHDALAGVAVLPLDAHRAALLGVELDLLGQPALELGGVGDQLPGAVGIDGEDDFAADGRA